MKKKIIIVCLIVLVILIGIFLVFNYNNSNSDSSKFKEEYEAFNNKNFISMNISKKNPFKYLNDENIMSSLKGKSKIVYLGYPDSNICRLSLPVFIDALKDNGVEEAYYYNFKKLEEGYEKGDSSSKELYEQLTSFLGDHLKTKYEDGLNKGNKKINIPLVFVVNKGKVVSYYEGLLDSHTDYSKKLNDEEYSELFKKYEDVILELIMCSDNC